MSIATITKARATRIVRQAKLNFRSVKDPRRKSNVVYSLQGLLNTAVAALAANKGTLRKMEYFAKDISPALRRQLGLPSRRTPSDSTYQKTLPRIEPKGFLVSLREQVKKALKSKAIRNDIFKGGVLSCDGKGIGSDKGEKPNELCRESVCDAQGTIFWYLYALRAHLTSSSVCPCIDQEIIEHRAWETTMFPEFLKRIVKTYPKLFQIVTADAGFTSRANATVVIKLKKLYLFALKKNQHRLYDFALNVIENQPVVAATEERYQGFIYRRELRRINCPERTDFPGAEQFWYVRQTRTKKDGKVTVEDRYFVTAVSAKMGAKQALKLVRLHWRIENNGNWTMDVIFDEDRRSPCKENYGYVIVNWLRLLAFTLVSIFRSHLPGQDKLPVPWDRAQDLIYQTFMEFGGAYAATI